MLADSLAGRIQIVRLHPLAQDELVRAPLADRSEQRSGFLQSLLEGRFAMAAAPRLGPELAERIAGGGYPAVLARPTGRRRANWYSDYLKTVLQLPVRHSGQIPFGRQVAGHSQPPFACENMAVVSAKIHVEQVLNYGFGLLGLPRPAAEVGSVPPSGGD